MPEARRVLIILLVACAPAVIPASAMPTASPDAPERIRKGYEQVASEILCYCGCSRLTIYECTCGTAHELRGQIEADLKAGKTPEQLIAAFVKDRGEVVRVVPPPRGFNLLAWIGPGIVIAGSSIAVLWVLVRWSKRSPPAIRPVLTDEQELRREAYEKRLAKDLSGIDL